MRGDPMKEEVLIFNILKNLGCDGILITDSRGEVVCIEEEFFREVWELNPKELLGKSVFELEKSGVIRPALAGRVIETKQPLRLISAVRGLYNIVGEAFPLMDEFNQIKWIVTFTRDVISERKVLMLYDEMLEGFKSENIRYPADCVDIDAWVANEGMNTFNEQFAEVLKKIKKIAPYDVTVLLTGDTGTGKTMLAKKIHKLSGVKGEFVELNCGAISETLIESELYGYENGAFTGAEKGGKKGLIEIAENGTLFLDEIAEMPIHLQVKLLHFLQEKKIRRVGGTREIKVNCRVISATNKNLQEEVKFGNFREDLFYRLNLVSFHIPPLCDRFEDIVPLSKSILKCLSIKYGKEYIIDYDVISIFVKYLWPGNIRELENTIHRMVLIADGNILRKDLLPKGFMIKTRKNNIMEYTQGMTIPTEITSLSSILEDVERAVIKEAWVRYGSSTKVAKALNIGQTTAARKIRKYVKTS